MPRAKRFTASAYSDESSIWTISCLAFLFALLLPACARIPAQVAHEAVSTAAIEAAIAKVKPALVRIHVVEAYYSAGRSLKSEAAGSGAIISPDGYVVTNHHVAGKAVRLSCTMPGGEEIPAKLIGTDALADIAIIKLEPRTPRTFPYAQWGDSDTLQVGDPVLALGSPLSLSQSVTEGIVSNARMTMPSLFWNESFELDGENVGSIVRWIGHDAAIYPGNSGGPLINLRGEVIGINEIDLGLSGAIPGNLARTVAAQLVKDHSITRAYMGFLMQPLFKEDPDRQGVLVSDVIKDSPAARAGLRPGDRLLSIAGHPVNAEYAEELPPVNLFVASQAIGKPVDVTLLRDGATLTKSVTPIVREPVQRTEHEFESLGLTGRDLSIWTQIELKRPNKDGVLVTSVRPGGPAGQAKPSIEEGDIILKLGSDTVHTMDELTSLTEKITAGKKETVPTIVTFERNSAEMETVADIGHKELNDPGMELRKAWLPIATQVLTRELAAQLKLGNQGGVRVTRIYEDRPTTATGLLQVGDVILKLNGDAIPAREDHDVEVFDTMVRQLESGTSATLAIVRDGKPMNITESLLLSPPPSREMKRYEDTDFDFTVRDVSYMDRKTRQWGVEKGGVMVDAVQEGGWAALGRLVTGDLLTSIDGKPIDTVSDVKDIMAAVKKEKKSSVIFKVRRSIHTLFVEIEPIWDKGV